MLSRREVLNADALVVAGVAGPDVPSDIASRLNRHCHCVGTDVNGLRRELDHAVDSSLETSHPHLFSKLPVFVSERDRSAMRETIRAIESVTALPTYRQLVLGSAPNTASDEINSRAGILGYDFHITGEGPQLIEINTNPGGALLAVEMLRAQEQCCDIVGEYLDTTFDPDAVERRIVEAFQREWLQVRGNIPLTSVAIVDDNPTSQYLYPEFLLFKRLFENHRIRAVIASSDQLYFRDGRVFAGELPIDLVYNRLTDFDLAAGPNTILREAAVADTVVLVPNPTAHALYASKTNLAVLTDADILRSIGVEGHVIDVLLRGIPQSHTVDLADGAEWWSRRKDWFFKPANGYGSKGSYRGDKVTRGAFSNITKGQYVAQRIALPSERGQKEGPPLKFDVRNYVHDGEIMLSAARLYQGQTTNFRTAGGGFAPVYTPKQEGQRLLGTCAETKVRS
jgi:hypothetical protein